jgi:hypothetical protein
MRYSERLRYLLQSVAYRRALKVIAIGCGLHIIANLGIVWYSSVVGPHPGANGETESRFLVITVAYWTLYPVVFWFVIYLLFRFLTPGLLSERRLKALHEARIARPGLIARV